MSIKKILIMLVFISSGLMASGYRSPGWQWSTYLLHKAIGLNDNQLSPEYLKSSLENCLSNLNVEDMCNGAGIWLILLSKIDSESTATINIANRLYQAIPDDFEKELYYLRRSAIRALARRGQTDKLFEYLEGDKPYNDIVLLLAENKDYSWAHLILESLDSDNSFDFCNGTAYMLPFLSENNTNRGVFVDKLIVAVIADSDHKAYCAMFQLFNLSLNMQNNNTVKSYVMQFLNATEVYKQKRAAKLISKWPLSMSKDSVLIAKMIQIAAASSDLNARFYLSRAIQKMGVISDHFPRFDPQQESPDDLVTVTSGSSKRTFEEYMISHPYNSMWLSYANNMQFTDWQNLLIVLEAGLYSFVDSHEKLQFFKDSLIVSQSRYLKLLLAKAAADTLVGSKLLTELYTSASNLQKNALIAYFPKHFASRTVVIINDTNLWIKLANLTNLLTICNIEVPPVSSELSDPAKLTKYLEDAEVLIKDCSRIKSK